MIRAKDIPKSVWGVPFDAFIGPVMIAESFGFDGRSDEFDVFFEADVARRVLWRSADGVYEIRPVADADDFEPPGTVLLLRGGTPVGFYAGGQSWIDAADRGRGLAPQMILASCLLCGGVPFDNTSPFGFSAAGYAAHAAAHRLAVDLAVEAGLPVPEHVRADQHDPAPAQ